MVRRTLLLFVWQQSQTGDAALNTDDALFYHSVRVFALAHEYGASQVGRLSGIHRSTYYRWKGVVDRSGREMLRPRERRRPKMPS